MPEDYALSLEEIKRMMANAGGTNLAGQSMAGPVATGQSYAQSIAGGMPMSQVIAPGVLNARPSAVDVHIIKDNIDRAPPIVIFSIQRNLHLEVKVMPPALAGIIHVANELTLRYRCSLHFEFIGDAALFEMQIKLIAHRVGAGIFDDNIIPKGLFVRTGVFIAGGNIILVKPNHTTACGVDIPQLAIR